MLHHRFARAIGQHPCVIQPVNGVGRASLTGQVCGSRTRVDVDFPLLTADLADGQCHRRSGHIDDHVDLVGVIPLASNVGANISLVLVVCADDFYFQAAFAALQIIFYRHLGGNH